MSVSRIFRLCSAWTGRDLWEATGRPIREFLICHSSSSVPNMSVMAPKNRWELQDMLEFAMNYDGPIAIRYPRGEAYRGLEGISGTGRVWRQARCSMRREGLRFWQSEAW